MKSIVMFLLVSICFPAFSAAAWPAPVTGRRLVCDSVDYNDKLRVFLDFDKSGASGDLEGRQNQIGRNPLRDSALSSGDARAIMWRQRILPHPLRHPSN